MLTVWTAVTVKVSAHIDLVIKFKTEVSVNLIVEMLVMTGGIVFLGRPIRRHILLRYISSRAHIC